MDNQRKYIDLLVSQFWKMGYLTVSRRFGTYLPEPGKVGQFYVDIIARYKKEYAIGIYISSQDFTDSNLLDKLKFLATRHTKFSNKKVKLFVGVPEKYLKQTKHIIGELDSDVRKNIKLIPIIDKSLPSIRRTVKEANVLFS